MKQIKFIFVIAFISSMSFMNPFDSAEKGLEIATLADFADQGFEDTQVNLTMILRNKRGQESIRSMTNQILEQSADGDKSLIIFNSPGDVKGTATLTYTHKQGPDDQWLYLPSIKRVKRISSDNKSGPFMGSEFAYEDLSSQEIEKYTYNYIGEDDLDDKSTIMVERFPVDPKSGYARQLVWYNPDKGFRIEKVEFYDRKDARLKSLFYTQYRQYEDKYWRAGKMLMINHQTNKETELIFEDYQFKMGLTEHDFSLNSLKRA